MQRDLLTRQQLWTLQDMTLRVDGCIQAARANPCTQHVAAAAEAIGRLQRYLDEIGEAASQEEPVACLEVGQ